MSLIQLFQLIFFAVKVLDKNFILRERKQKYVQREKEALLKLANTRGIVQLTCTFQSQTKLFFVFTLASGRDLQNYIKNMSLESARYYAAQLLLCIEEMHKKYVIHRDIKPQNIFLDKNMKVLLGDFGSSKILTSEEVQQSSNNNNNDNENPNEAGDNNEKKTKRNSFVGTGT
jgi:3-phosphoinositide dependent protein kinase-1